MGNTPNHNIYFLSNGDPQSQITESATQAGTIEAALDGISGNIESVNNFGVQYFANASARDLALTNPGVGWLTQLDSELFMRRWDGSAWRPYGSGFFPINPSSVSGTGVSVDANGTVVFTSATSVNIDGVFSGDFTNYRIEFDMTAASTDIGVGLQLRSGGTSTTANYVNFYAAAVGSSMVVTTGSTDRFNNILTSGRQAYAEVSVRGPAVSGPTLGQSTYSGFTNAGAGYTGLIANRHASSAVFDGVGFLPSAAGNFTGTVRIFGVA